MPILEEGVISSFDVDTNARDISELFYRQSYPTTPFFNGILVGTRAINKVYEWGEDALYPVGTKLSANYVAASGTMTVVSTAGIRVDMIINVGRTVLRVTAIDRTTKVLTVVALSNDANQASGTEVKFSGTARPEGSSGQKSDYVPKQLVENYTQIVDDFVEITGTERAIKRMFEDGDLLTDDAERKLARIYFELARGVFINPRYKAVSTNEASIAGGIDFFANLRGYAPAASAFSSDSFDEFLQICSLDRGADVSEVWMNPTEISNFVNLHADKLVVERADEKVGRIIKTYLSKYGYAVALKTDPQIPTKRIYTVKQSMVRIKPLRAFEMRNPREDGDNWKMDIRGELTFEINPSNKIGVFSIS